MAQVNHQYEDMSNVSFLILVVNLVIGLLQWNCVTIYASTFEKLRAAIRVLGFVE